ncbi:MAG: hypothetical protein IAG10_27630 [Planctomycetaceae bacterium]|nr:hypothetical protein [Planctomycetaceae bacterium]
MTQFSDWMVRTLDSPLGWLLLLPRDVTLLVFSAMTALLMTLARRWVTNQDLLRRCSDDLRQLKRLNREAKQAGDKPRRQRLRNTVALVKRTQLAEDMKVLVVVLIPVAALAMWAVERLAYLPPRAGEDFSLRATFSASSVDEVTHLVPIDGVELQSSPIQIIQPDQQSSPLGSAEWSLRPTSATDELTLTIRHHGESVEHRVAVGRTTYLPPQQLHQNERLTQTEVLLKRYRPLGLNLKTEWLGLPAWMVGYLLLTLLLVPGLKRLLRVS